MAEQLVQQDTSIFIFNTRKPAVNVLMDIQMDQGKKKNTQKYLYVPSATTAQLSKKQQSFYSSFHPLLN